MRTPRGSGLAAAAVFLLMAVAGPAAARADDGDSCRALAEQYRHDWNDHGRAEYEAWLEKFQRAVRVRGALQDYMDRLPPTVKTLAGEYLAGRYPDAEALKARLSETAATLQAPGQFSATDCKGYADADSSGAVDGRHYSPVGTYQGMVRMCEAPEEPGSRTGMFEGCIGNGGPTPCHPLSGWHWVWDPSRGFFGPIHSDSTFVPRRTPAMDRNILTTTEAPGAGGKITVFVSYVVSPDGQASSLKALAYALSLEEIRDGRVPSVEDVLRASHLPESMPRSEADYVRAHLGNLYETCQHLGVVGAIASPLDEAVATGPRKGGDGGGAGTLPGTLHGATVSGSASI